MKINGTRTNLTTVYKLENGHLYKTPGGAIGLKIGGKFFYFEYADLDKNMGDHACTFTYWDVNKDGRDVKCTDLGRLVSVDEVTVE